MDDLARSFELDKRFLERLSTRTEPFEHGVAYFDEGYRERYDSNLLLADRDLESARAEALIEAADRILGGAGYEHRKVVVNEAVSGERFARAFGDAGYGATRFVTMTHRRGPDRPPVLDVEVLRFEEIRPLIREMYRREPDLSDRVVHLFTDQHGKLERTLGVRFLAGRVDGRLAGNCELWVDGENARVENVGTLEEFRGRGVARAVVLRAVEMARDEGARRIFVTTEEEDWPKYLYARLGFDALGTTWEFLRSGAPTEDR